MKFVHKVPILFVLATFAFPCPAQSQSLNLPARPYGAPDGSEFTNIVSSLTRDEREQWIYAQIITGNVPDFLRTLKPITATSPGHSATYHVTPDYIGIGSDTDYFLAPMTPLLAQRLCDRLGYSMPTRRMVNQIWTNTAVKLNPQPIAASPEMTTVPVFAWHNFMVRTQRNAFTNSQPLGALVGGDKKDVIVSARIYTNFATAITEPVVIYGWHYPSGSPIQPLYNGHEETYADYSHGVRFVQMNIVVDGATNSVTNVLTNPVLAPLLSDDSTAEGTSGGVIPLPRYTLSPLAPKVMIHPRSQSALPGTNITLDAVIIGDLPLSHRWRMYGTNIPGATNSSFTISNLTLSTAGSYSLVVTNPAGAVTSRVAVVRMQTTLFPRLFAESFETNNAANWNLFWGSGNGVPDYTVDWSYDYAATPYTFNGVTALIPRAPNSPLDETRALKFAVNNNDATASQSAVNVYPKNVSISGNFVLKFDLWINYPGNAAGAGSSGSTERAQFGINHLGTNVNWAALTATASDGIWFAAAGEGGDSRDYRSYVGNLSGLPTELTGSPVASGLIGSNHNAAVFQTLFPSSLFETAGAPGKSWIEVELRQTNNIVLWLMNGAIIAQRTNTSAFTNGNIMLGFMDTFPSIASPARDAFVLFDNVRVENLAPPIRFDSITRLPDGSVSLMLDSAFGDSFLLQTSTNLTAWQTLGTVNMTNSPSSFIHGAAGAVTPRFYRARR